MKMKLADISKKISKGSTPRGKVNYSKNENNYFLRVTDMVDLANVYNSEFTLSDEDINKNKMKMWPINTILVSIEGTVGKISILKKEMSFNQAVAGIIPNEEIINPRYLMYYLRTTPVFSGILKGTIMPALRLGDLSEIEIEVPDMEIQNKMVSIVDSITNKIDLNNKTNNNLLQLCRYKYDELNKRYDSWNLAKINDLNLEVTDYVANGSFKSLADNVTLYDEKEYALYVRNTDLKVKFTDKRKYVDQKSYEFLKKSKLKGGELIISNVGDVGSVFICPHLEMPMTLGSNVIMLYEKDNHYYNYFLYFFFTSVYGQYMIEGITGGSAQPKFNKTDFRNMEIKFPTLDELDRFNAEIDPIYKKYELNIKENEKLSQLRDTLLSKLMNGEIDLDNIEI